MMSAVESRRHLQNFRIEGEGAIDGAACFERVVKCAVVVRAQVATEPDQGVRANLFDLRPKIVYVLPEV
jgi:hypothetical protein